MRIFKTRTLAKFTRQNGISDLSLADAVERATRGLIDADLGGRLIKQRVARPGQGKRGGFRMLIGFGVRSCGFSFRLCQERTREHRRCGVGDIA